MIRTNPPPDSIIALKAYGGEFFNSLSQKRTYKRQLQCGGIRCRRFWPTAISDPDAGNA